MGVFINKSPERCVVLGYGLYIDNITNEQMLFTSKIMYEHRYMHPVLEFH